MSGTGEHGYDIAIIGMSCRFPGARNPEEFWRRLAAGDELITTFSNDDLLSSGVEKASLEHPAYVKAEGAIEGIDLFDAAFFGFTPREAEMTDPQQRLFLEAAWEALENAAYDPDTCRRRIGVYTGSSLNSYQLNSLYSSPGLTELVGAFQASIGGNRDHLPTQISYKLNLTGPSINIQTACSTSLVAVHLACQSLLGRECDIALAGGVSIGIPHGQGYRFEEGGILSPDGHCRAFDADAAGTVPGSGLGIVVLKRMSDAIADRDFIHAVIKSTAVNNDGALKAGFTAPSIDGQASVIQEALAMADVDGASIQYIETHGTGTALGDPIEVAALTQVFRSYTDRKRFCRIGSVKTNIGHLDAAAGVAGLIKTVLALEHGKLPPSLHFNKPNPKIDFNESPFYVGTSLSDWKREELPRRAGVSSFGIGGTNAHVILEEAPSQILTPVATPETRRHELIVISAKTTSALDATRRNLLDTMRDRPELNLRDVAYTLQVGRKGFSQRRAIVCESISDAIAKLESAEPTEAQVGAAIAGRRRVAFVFPGQGSQYIGMAKDIYDVEPSFRNTVDRCSELLKEMIGTDLRELLFGRRAQGAARAQDALDHTSVAQPALFVVEYSLARWWMDAGVIPDSMIGHSIGEYVAACLSGVMSLEDALFLVAERGKLMGSVAAGAMLAVALDEEAMRALLNRHKGVSLAAINSQNLMVVSGADGPIAEIEQALRAAEIVTNRLHVSHAFHSKMMDSVLDEFQRRIESVQLHPPSIPYISNTTGTWITDDEATTPAYYSRHLRKTVRFSEGVGNLSDEPDRILLEMGSGQALKGIGPFPVGTERKPITLRSLRHPKEPINDNVFLLSTLGRLWVSGVEVDWKSWHSNELCCRVQLPVYPFERKRYWIEPSQQQNHKPEVPRPRNPNQAEWFYVPSWKRIPLPDAPISDDRGKDASWLIFADPLGIGAKIADLLRANGKTAIVVSPARSFSGRGGDDYSLDPEKREDYLRLIKNLRISGRFPNLIIHLWNVTHDWSDRSLSDTYKDALTYSFSSLLFLAQAIGEEAPKERIALLVASNGLHDVVGTEYLMPAKALMRGPCTVIPLEYPNISCRSVDIAIQDPQDQSVREISAHLIDEASSPSSIGTIAYRARHRWVQTFEQTSFRQQPSLDLVLKPGGVYLITGGLGDVEFAFAGYAAETAKARLVLMGLPKLPDKAGWKDIVTDDADSAEDKTIARILALESLGATVLPIVADFTDIQSLTAALEQVRSELGPINGVIHSAFTVRGGMIQLKTIESAEDVLGPRVRGTIVIDELLSNDPLDFFVVFSTTLAINGVFGQVDYCSSNAFADAFGWYRRSRGGAPALSVNWDITSWDTWQESAMSAVPQIQAELRSMRAEYGISPNEALDSLMNVIPRCLPQVVISTQDFVRVLQEQNKATDNALFEQLGAISFVGAGHERPAGAASYVPPSGEIEPRLAGIWQDVFGIAQIGARDDFFDTGGNSLIAIQVMSRLRKEFDVDLPLSALFEHPTIEGLAGEILAARAEAEEAKEMERLLAEIEDLSPDQVKSALALEQSSREI
jgi:acyl transferase domain-containing protein/acyl carrier protein